MKRNVVFILGLFCFLFAATVIQAASYADIINQLYRFQDTTTGGFKDTPRGKVSLESTHESLFLYSLYGLHKKVDVSNVPSFVNGHRNPDGGYSEAGFPSSLESTWRAVQSSFMLRTPVPDQQSVVSFIRSQADSQGLFGGNIESTYYAIESLSALGEQFDKASISRYLQQHQSSNKFTVATQEENLFAILVAGIVGFPINNANDFASNIASFQTGNGGFFEEIDNPVTSFKATALSLEALAALDKMSDSVLSNLVNYDSVVSFVQTVPYNINLAYHAHRSLLFSPYFKSNFKYYTSFDSNNPTKDGTIFLGSQFKPSFSARAFGAIANSGFNIVGVLSFADASTQQVPLAWDAEHQYYTANEFISANSLGPVDVTYQISYFVPTVGEFHFSTEAEAFVGYSITVAADATNELTGRTIKLGDSISVGTAFTFTVVVKDKNNRVVSSGDFEVSLTAVDSSGVPIYSTSVSAVDNKGSFQFPYTLESETLPPGHLSFIFEVKNSQGERCNVQQLQYLISTPIVTFDLIVASEQKLGDNVQVSFHPAVFTDNREVIKINPTNRNFFLDVVSQNGKTISSYRGRTTSDAVVFDFIAEPTFDFVGTSQLSFRYVTSEGLSVLLGNYDSAINDIVDDASTFTINTELHVEVTEQPGNNDFFYGNEITFRYSVIDNNSQLEVSQGKYGHTFLALNHVDEKSGRSFTSANVIATPVGDELEVTWEINPNAVEGQGTLVLGAVDASGNELALLEAKTQRKLSYDVTIGGEIVSTNEFFDFKDFYSSKSSFVLEFGLSCHHKPLKNAKLRASVLKKEGPSFVEVASIPVAASGESYSASFATKHKNFASGEYKIQVFREIDQTRDSDSEDQKQKLLREKQREAELNGEQFDEAAFLATLSVETGDAKPILETTFTHKEISKGGLFVRTEWLILIPLVAAFLFFDGKKRSYMTPKPSKY